MEQIVLDDRETGTRRLQLNTLDLHTALDNFRFITPVIAVPVWSFEPRKNLVTLETDSQGLLQYLQVSSYPPKLLKCVQHCSGPDVRRVPAIQVSATTSAGPSDNQVVKSIVGLEGRRCAPQAHKHFACGFFCQRDWVDKKVVFWLLQSISWGLIFISEWEVTVTSS